MQSGHPTRPGGIPSPLETIELSEALQTSGTAPQRYSPSMSFIVSMSIVFGLILAVGAVIGVMGKAFYVTRTEYDEKTLRDTMESATVKSTLERVERALSSQEAAFDKALSSQEASFNKLSDAVQAIKVDMASRKK